MRVPGWRFRLALWLCLALASVVARAQPLELTQAHVVVRVQGTVTEQAVVLPYAWDLYHQGHPGEATFDLHFDLPAVPVDPWGLFLERLGNAYEIRLNGLLLERVGDLEHFNGNDAGQIPRLLSLPEGYLSTANRLSIRIRTDAGRHGGLSKILIGPMETVSPIYRESHLLRSTGTVLVTLFSLIVGLAALALWATQTQIGVDGRLRRDPLYLFAAFAELAWSLRVGNAHIEFTPLPWPWWGIVPVTALGVWAVCMVFFCMELTVWRRTPLVIGFRRGLVLLMALGPGVAAWAIGGDQPLLLTLWYAALGICILPFSIWFLVRAARSPQTAQRLVALALGINVLVGLRDLYAFRIHPSYPSTSLMYYTSSLFGVMLGYVVIARFREASAQVRELMSTLTLRVAQRERELNSSYQRLEVLAREQERTAERTRILRDMHDGVGSHISAAIRQLQSGRASQTDVLQTLRESLDQLKLTIDAMHLPPGDVTALLANLRYRLEPRLRASDIELQWDVDLIEPIRGLDSQAMRHLQFMVFEALSNVLQHAHAHRLRIETIRADQGVRLRIVDDGAGFDSQQPGRKGLASLRDRAKAIGAHLLIDSQPGCTVVEIVIPVV
jgi:signal transduction histidine kinase